MNVQEGFNILKQISDNHPLTKQQRFLAEQTLSLMAEEHNELFTIKEEQKKKEALEKASESISEE